MTWVRRHARQSWHAFRAWSEADNRYAVTLCGRRLLDVEVRDSLPAGRSCESCLRIYGRTQDR